MFRVSALSKVGTGRSGLFSGIGGKSAALPFRKNMDLLFGVQEMEEQSTIAGKKNKTKTHIIIEKL